MNYSRFTTKLVLRKLEKNFVDFGNMDFYLQKQGLTVKQLKEALYFTILKEYSDIYTGPDSGFMNSLVGGIDTALDIFYEKYLDYLTINDPTSDLVFMNID